MNTTAVAETIGRTERIDTTSIASSQKSVNNALFLALLVAVQVAWMALLTYASLTLF